MALTSPAPRPQARAFADSPLIDDQRTAPDRKGQAPGSTRAKANRHREGIRVMCGPGRMTSSGRESGRTAGATWLRFVLAGLAGIFGGLTGRAGEADTDKSGRNPKPIDFNRDIRPILADKCFKCHGPDARERKGKLRLDNRRDATAPAASGSPAIVPGKLDDSELYQRITADDPDERMPPPKSGKTLSAAEVAQLKTWIEQGAEYQGTLGVRRRRSARRCPR